MKFLFATALLLACWCGISYATQHAPVTVEPSESIVFNISQNADLWFFNNQHPSNYHTTVALTAVGPTEGSFTWNVITNATAAKMANGTTSMTVQTPTVDVLSAGISSLPNDIGINFLYNGEDVGVYQLTAYAPTSVHMLEPGIVHSTIQTFVPLTSVLLTNGYQSVATFEILDQFDNEIPEALPINEFFGLRVDDYAGTNWSSGEAAAVVSHRFTDTWSVVETLPSLPGLTPHPTPPQTPLSSIGVFHSPQGYAVGSLSIGVGRQVELHTLQMLVDHATISPIP